MSTRSSAEQRCLIEPLESRLVLSAVVQFDGFTLRVTGDNGPQTLRIFDAHTPNERQAVVLLDANGNGSFTDPGDLNGLAGRGVFSNVRVFDIRMNGGNDAVDFRLANNYVGANKTLRVNLGRGNDSFSFINVLSDLIGSNSRVVMNVLGGDGNDNGRLSLNNVRQSTLNARFEMGRGNDRLQLSAFGDIGGGAQVTANSFLGEGNDTYSQEFDLEGFDILGSRSAARFNASGNNGNDTLTARAAFPQAGTFNEGLLAINLWGGNGSDTTSIDLARFTANGGTFRLRTNGGNGNDRARVAAAADAQSRGGLLDVALQGDNGADSLAVNLNDFARTSRFGPAGAALINGGNGPDTCTTSGNARFRVINCET